MSRGYRVGRAVGKVPGLTAKGGWTGTLSLGAIALAAPLVSRKRRGYPETRVRPENAC
jgi:hypothetical protein